MHNICYSIQDIKRLTGAIEVKGDYASEIRGIGTLKDAVAGDLSFLGNKKYRADVKDTNASVVLIPQDYEGEPKKNQSYIVVKNPSMSLAIICREIEATLWPKPESKIHPTAVVADSAKVASGVYVGPHAVIEAGAVIGVGAIIDAHVYIGRHASIGSNSWIMPKATVLDYCIIGNRVKLSSGAVIGSDGFGYETISGVHQKVPQVGIVRIGDDVDIGANATIDRARFGETLIGKGTKIDNLVQIGHNVQVGENCIIVAQAGISGSCVIEDNVVIAGQVGIAGHLRIGKGSQLSAQCGVNHDLEPGSFVRGTPASPFMLANRVEVLKRRLPELFKRVEKLEENLQHACDSTPNSAQ